jgi:hypothetical protein
MPQTVIHEAILRIDEELLNIIVELGNDSGRNVVQKMLDLLKAGKTREEALAEVTGTLDFSWRVMDILSDMLAQVPEGSEGRPCSPDCEMELYHEPDQLEPV